jgi:hypothetical protein
MRHFLRRDFGPQAVAVARLPHRLEAASSRLDPVRGGGAPKRLSPSHWPALTAQPLTLIAATAETQLNSTPLAAREPVFRRRQRAPCRRFLDMEREP